MFNGDPQTAKAIWAVVSPQASHLPLGCLGNGRGIGHWYEILSASHGAKSFWTSKGDYVAQAVVSSETTFVRFAENSIELISKLPPYEQHWNGCGQWKRLWAEDADKMMEMSGSGYLNDQTVTVQIDISHIFDQLKHLLQPRPPDPPGYA